MCDPVGAVKDVGNWVDDRLHDVPDWATYAFPPLPVNKIAFDAAGFGSRDTPAPPKPPPMPGAPPDLTDEEVRRAADAQRRRSMLGGGRASMPSPILPGKPPSATGY